MTDGSYSNLVCTVLYKKIIITAWKNSFSASPLYYSYTLKTIITLSRLECAIFVPHYCIKKQKKEIIVKHLHSLYVQERH